MSQSIKKYFVPPNGFSTMHDEVFAFQKEVRKQNSLAAK